MLHAVVLAGGSGTRLWPASRRARPKQFLTLGGGDTLLGATVRRARALTSEITIVTADEQVAATRAIAPDVAILGEPCGRNTAAAIGLAAAAIARRDPAAVLVIMPADQHIADPAGLERAIRLLVPVAEAGAIGVLGIQPTRAEVGFGYIELGAAAGDLRPVLRFVEKPDRATAEAYLASGRYMWNAGWFVATAARLLAELDAQLPDTGAAVRAPDVAARYPALTSISIDHGVMEKAANIVCAPADIGWDDIGSWAAVPVAPDAAGNRVVGDALVLDGTGNIVTSDGGLVALVGVSDLVVVRAGDAVLVIPKDRAQDVRAIVDALVGARDRYR